jgi:benzylsuccinate CoA-transferase BbsF subunit
VGAGPQCCRLRADLGAEVIKIESDKRVDNYRTANSPAGPPYGYNKAVGYNTLNRNKLGIRLNLGIAEGRDLVLRLAATADLVVENFAPRVMPGWGLSWDDFARVNPAITMLSMSAMGATGPDRDYVLYGNSQVALAGIGAATGFRGGPPENVGLAHGDPIAAFHGAFAAVAAVYHARRTGEGQHIDMSQWEAVAATYPEGLIELGLNGVEPERRGNADEWLAPHGYYRCADRADEGAPAAGESDTRPVTLTDAWIAIAVESDAQWRALCAVLDRPAWRDDPRFATAEGRRAHAAELDGLIEQATMGRDAAALARDLQAAGVAAAKVTTIADVVRDEQLLARGFFQYIDHPEAGRGRYFGTPWKLSASPARLYRHAPLFGGDTAHVITDLLGLPADEVARLDAAGVFY